jgi:hypothetical protein
VSAVLFCDCVQYECLPICSTGAFAAVSQFFNRSCVQPLHSDRPSAAKVPRRSFTGHLVSVISSCFHVAGNREMPSEGCRVDCGCVHGLNVLIDSLIPSRISALRWFLNVRVLYRRRMFFCSVVPFVRQFMYAHLVQLGQEPVFRFHEHSASGSETVFVFPCVFVL